MKKILITEDSPTILAMMKEALESKGYQTITAVDGQEALNKAKKEKPDLIVLDLMLPKIDGFKLCAIFKHDVDLRDTPIIILTAKAGEQDRKTADEVCANAYLTKPFEADVLLGKIEELLKD